MAKSILDILFLTVLMPEIYSWLPIPPGFLSRMQPSLVIVQGLGGGMGLAEPTWRGKLRNHTLGTEKCEPSLENQVPEMLINFDLIIIQKC